MHQHWREWKREKMEREKNPPRPRKNTSETPPLTPSSSTTQDTLKDFLSSVGYAPDANGVWVNPNIQPPPAATVNLYEDFQLACTLFNELTPAQRILEAAGHVTISALHPQALNAVKCGILLSAALDGDQFDLA